MTLVALACGACGAEATSPPPERDEPWFALRGRWDHGDEIAVGFEAGDDPRDLQAAFRRAAAGWNDLRGPRLRAAREGETPNLWISFERGLHGPCAPFGRDSTRAHAGPLEDPTWIHLDAGRDFDGTDLPLARVLGHELGHVLGLDHVEDPTSIMDTDPRVDRPGPTDAAGIHSLYGGGVDGPADLWVGPDTVLRGVAPPGRVDFAVFDVHADGRDELLLWRTDPEGHGRMTVVGFDERLRPRGSFVLEGAALPGFPLAFVSLEEEGADEPLRLLVIPRAEVGPLVLRFGSEGRLSPWRRARPPALPDPLPSPSQAGDLNGDGRPENVRRGVR